MTGETNLSALIRNMNPVLNDGEYVFLSTTDLADFQRADTLFEFKEKEGITIVLERGKADELGLQYDFSTAWITLMVHSSLAAVGLTAAFSSELATNNISCNVISGYYHDHIFVPKSDAQKAVDVLKNLSKKY